MNTDRELLELAAKAAGIVHQGYCSDGYLFVGDGESGMYTKWNPIEQDGDALRLAVACHIDLLLARRKAVGTKVEGYAPEVTFCDYKDRPEATRRVIVRAAAGIGRAMEPKRMIGKDGNPISPQLQAQFERTYGKR